MAAPMLTLSSIVMGTLHRQGWCISKDGGFDMINTDGGSDIRKQNGPARRIAKTPPLHPAYRGRSLKRLRGPCEATARNSTSGNRTPSK